MLGRTFIAQLLALIVYTSLSVHGQGVTFLIKGKVVDTKKQVLQGVQVYAKDGDEIVGKSKTTNTGDFTMTLKPGRTYSMSFERSDVYVANQDFRLPNGTSYQEISQEFTIRVLSKGDTIQQFQVFSPGQSSASNSPMFSMLSTMMKKMQHLKVKIIVSEGSAVKDSGKTKKAKATKKQTKGKKGSSQAESTPPTLLELRIQELRTQLLNAGAPESRIVFEKGKLSASMDVALIINEISGGF